jgi:hypothetical protein
VIKNAPAETSKKFEQKRAEEIHTMLNFMESRRETAQRLIDDILTAMGSPIKLEKAGINQLATALGIIVDKYRPVDERGRSNGTIETASNAVGDFLGALKAPAPNRGITDFEGEAE